MASVSVALDLANDTAFNRNNVIQVISSWEFQQMTVSMVSTDESTRGIDDLRRCTEVGQMVQAGSAGGSYENGETKSDDRNRMNHRRGTRANNGKERSLKSRRPKHKRSSCSKEDTGERRDNYYRQETPWEAPGLGVPGVLDTSAGKKDVGDNGLGKMVSAKEIAQSRQDISGGRRSKGVGDWGSDSYTVHSKVEKSTSKSSPRISKPKTTLATRTAYHPVEKGAQYSSSTVLEGQISRRRERRSENRFLCQTGAVEDGDQHVIDRKQQAKRLALEIAKLRSALRVSNSDLAAERKVRARLEDDRWEQAQAWGHERGVIVSAKQEAERALQAAQEELATLRKQTKVQAAAHEVSLLKAESALNRVIKVQDRLVQALQTEVDLTNRARTAAQEQLHQCERDFLTWRDHAKLLEGQMDKMGHPLPRPHDHDPPSHTHASSMLLASSAQSSRWKESQSDNGKGSRSTGGGIVCKDREFPAGNREVECNVDDLTGSAGEASLGSRDCPLQRDPGISNTNEACLEDVQGFFTLHNRFDDGRHPPTSRGPEKTTATPEACLVKTNEAMASSTGPSDLKENFERSMRAQQEISIRIEKELARARADLDTIYVCNRKESKKGATIASHEDRNHPGVFTDGYREGPGRKGNDCDGGTNHNADEFEVPGPHSARVLAALLGLETSSDGKTSGAEDSRRNLGGKAYGTATGVAGVGQLSSKPHLRLSDYPPQIQAIFRREPPPLMGVPIPVSDKIAIPRLHQPSGGSHPQAAAAQEKGAIASFIARGIPKEGYALVGAFREYEPKSPMLRMWLTEKSSPASLPDEEK